MWMSVHWACRAVTAERLLFEHAQNRWRYDMMHKMTALSAYVVMQGGFKHKLHASVVDGWRVPPMRTLCIQIATKICITPTTKYRRLAIHWAIIRC